MTVSYYARYISIVCAIFILLVACEGKRSGLPNADTSEDTPMDIQNAPEPGCVYVIEGGHRYWFCEKDRNWQQARDRCLAVGGDLVTIEDNAENDFIYANMVRMSRFCDLELAWIGANDIATEGTWVWASNQGAFWNGRYDGSPVDRAFNNWGLMQPDKDDCGRMSVLGEKWIASNCSMKHPYICELEHVPVDSAPESDCRHTTLNGKDYYYCKNERRFDDARARCQSVGMDLVAIELAEEDAWLSNLIDEHVWIGASDSESGGDWKWLAFDLNFWSNAGPVNSAYTNWEAGYPDWLISGDCAAKDPPIGKGNWETFDCDLHMEYVCEQILRLEAVETWTLPALPAEGAFTVGGIDASNTVLTTTEKSVLRIAADGVSTIVAAYPEPQRFNVETTGTRFGVYTSTQFEARTSSGVLITAYERQPSGYGLLVPGSDLVFIPELEGDEKELLRVTHARFFDPAGEKSLFAAPGLSISRHTPTHVVYSDDENLIRTTVDGIETWRIALSLTTFEIASNGSELIGVSATRGNSRVLHVNLNTGVASAPTTLDAVFWNIAMAPSGRYSVATTKTTAYLFDSDQLLRRVELPANWTVSADVSDSGYVAVGAQDASHAAMLILFAPNSDLLIVPRPATDDGYRPHVKFYADGQKLLVNEPGGLTAFDIQTVP